MTDCAVLGFASLGTPSVPVIPTKLQGHFTYAEVTFSDAPMYEGTVSTHGGLSISVTLDMETANPWLEVSEDLKSLRWTGTQRSLPDTRQRFTHWACALGSEGFTSGRHYWEVEVTGNRGWSLGVAAESVERKEWVRLRPETGFWTIERFDDQFYINSSPESRLPVGQIPGKVGVYLSYESGTVSFYNVDTKSHLHTFTGNRFTEKLYPFCGTWDKNNKWLRICSGSDWINNRGGALTSQ
ncbi:E3 ubiquitin-protein ligase TRIM39-like [Scyliorhinus canicula]|uniref:E3 ubiquitin-protein ligase TRIM39-like n=1 Tax=Scyliorhinus canicula TaxID=7830 RepID=UPI0018F704DB|nr:E3 ubiquitin-protein ligase TRIM39-like [Scyliorhinus canicula]